MIRLLFFLYLSVLLTQLGCETDRSDNVGQSADTAEESSPDADTTSGDSQSDVGQRGNNNGGSPNTAWSEPLTDFADLSDLKTGYDPSQWYPTFLELLNRRYPTGRFIVESLSNSEQEAKQWLQAVGNIDTFAGLVQGANTTVHEMNHGLSFQEGIATNFDTYAYVLREDLTYIVPRITTFNRKEILPYLTGPLAKGSNGYYFYIEDTIASHDFFSVLDEFNAYIHSSFTGYGLHDEAAPGLKTSDRNGTLTFMLYTQYYLLHARENHPNVYSAILADPDIKELVGSLWKRAVFILDVTKDIPALEINAGPLETLMLSEELQQEIAPFLD